MKKRCLSFLLALCVCVSLIPASLAAEGFMLGDVDGDGQVTIGDAKILADYLDDPDGNGLTREQLLAADVDGDGEPTNRDMLLIQQYALGAIDAFPAEGGDSDPDPDPEPDPYPDFKWTFNGKTLTISGPGDMPNFESESDAPWYSYRSDVVNVVIQEGVTSVGDYAFYNFLYLETVTIPASVTSIGDNAFSDCHALTSVMFSGGVDSIGECAFWWCDALTYVMVPGNVGSIGAEAFSWNHSLADVTVKGAVNSVGERAFAYSDNLTSISFESVNAIGEDAFWGCDNLSGIYCGVSKAQWARVAAGVEIPSGCTVYCTDGEIDASDPDPDPKSDPDPDPDPEPDPYPDFKWTFNGKTLTISGPGDMPNFEGSSDAPWSVYSSGVVNVVIQEGVTSVGDYAFNSYWDLESVTLPTSVSSVGSYAFEWCNELTEITFPGDIDSIGDNAFWWCDALTDVTFKGNVRHIGADAFDCDNLARVTFSGNVDYINESAFAGCDNLADIYYGGTTAQWKRLAAEVSVPALCTIHCKNGDIEPDLDPELSISSDSTTPGGIASVGIYAEFVKMTGLTVRVSYPGNALSVRDVTYNQVFESEADDAKDGKNPVQISWVAGSAKEVSYRGELCEINFDVSESAAPGEYALKLEVLDASAGGANVTDDVVVYDGEIYVYEGDPEDKTYVVTFDANGGSPTFRSTVPEGEKLDEKLYASDEPTRDGYRFMGWFADRDCTTAFDINTPITSNLTLYAGWKALSYVVKFDANGGSAVDSVTVRAGDKVSRPNDPKRDGYAFADWFAEKDGKTAFDFSTPITANLTLYAGWNKVQNVPGLADLTYLFGNSASGLGYEPPYKIPYVRYKMIFGDTVSAKQLYKNSAPWAGSCYGFSGTAAMFSQTGNGVSTDAFRSGATLPSQLQTGDKNAQWGIDAREFLEAMQISQNHLLIQNDYRENKNKLNELCAAADAYQKTGTNPVIVAVFGPQGGHALLAYKLEDNKLYVYDCNYPNTERYVTLKANADGSYVSWYYHLNDKYDWGSAYDGCWISYVPYEHFYHVWANRAEKPDEPMELLTVNANVVLKDSDGMPLASLKDGKLTTMQPDIYPFVEIGITSDGEAKQNDTMSMWIPVNFYKLDRTGDYVHDGGEIVLLDGDHPFEVSVTHVDQAANVSTTADKLSFFVDDKSQVNQVTFDENVQEGTYNIMFQSTLDGEQSDEQITGNIMSHVMTFGMVEGKAVADEASLVSIKSYMTLVNNEMTDSNENVSVSDTTLVTFSANKGSGSMLPRKVTDDGQFTFPECEFDPPSPERTFLGWMFDGKLYQPEQTVQVVGDAVAVAQWSGYGIGDVSADGADVTVRLFSAVKQSVSVAVCAYSDGGKMLASVVRTVNGAASANVTLNLTGAAYLKAFLLDPDANAPLCEPFRKDLK